MPSSPILRFPCDICRWNGHEASESSAGVLSIWFTDEIRLDEFNKRAIQLEWAPIVEPTSKDNTTIAEDWTNGGIKKVR